MPNKNGEGPRKRSPRPSKKRGGLKKGNCKPEKGVKLGGQNGRK